MSAHTKGPWRVVQENDYDFSVGIVMPDLRIMFVASGIRALDTAQMMAAAPDLLDEVRGLMRYLENVAPLLDGDAPESGVRSMIERARAAIAKAEGRS